jgi:dephospho-CoA kinase
MKSQGIKIGVTGGIGSGKTTVCRIFNTLGIPVFAADLEARRIMDSDPDIIGKVIEATGKGIYSSGELNRSELASLIFNNSELLEKINSIVHPAVRNCFEEWATNQSAPYVILEAAILLESKWLDSLDRVITVTAPMEERIRRVVLRNNLTREQVMERIRNQSDDEYKISRSDYVIDNSDNKMIIPEILGIHSDILEQINLLKKNG